MKTKDTVIALCILCSSLVLFIGGLIQLLSKSTLSWGLIYHLSALILGGLISWVVFIDLKRNWNR